MNYQYKFEEHPAPKGKCPSCDEKNTFRFYQDQPREFGKCERINACGYSKQPNGNEILNAEKPIYIKPEKKVVYPDKDESDFLVKSATSTFHNACKSFLNIPQEHFEKWKVGSIGSKTVFVSTDILGRAVNVKFIQYEENCKRNKNVNPHSLSPKNQDEKYSTCLFGEHLLSDKTIVLVESEKTAFISSYFYPLFDWLATGSRNGLTDRKIHVLSNKNVIYLPDADSAGRENSTINKLKFHNINFIVKDLFPERTDGYDLADSIFEQSPPEIIDNFESPLEAETTKKNIDRVDDSELIKLKKINHESKLVRVERFITQHYELRYNIVANEIEIKTKGSISPFIPVNVNNLFRFLESNFVNVSLSNLEALLRSDFVREFDPFAEYFESLERWCIETDIDYINQITKYVKVKNSEVERFKIQLKKHLVRCVACALNDRYFNKHCLVFVFDQQNSGKSTLCRWFCPPALENYISEAIATDKDSLIALSDNFIINIDEMATMDKGDIQALKSLFSKDRVKARPPYGKKSIMFPRRASFFGSTDRTEFLNDDAGTVRWLCFQLERIDWNYTRDIDINDVWRQAYALLKGGKFKYDLTFEELNENENVNKGFKITSTEVELINRLYEPATKESHDFFYTATDLQLDLIQRSPIKVSTMNIGRALKALGFVQVPLRKHLSAYPIKGYYLKMRKEDTTPTTENPTG